jgi:hypothetical protein
MLIGAKRDIDDVDVFDFAREATWRLPNCQLDEILSAWET